jgi:hypothetical protein
MEKDKVDLHSEIARYFVYVPLPIRKAAIELKNHPLWQEIGKVLIKVPIDETVNNTRLRNSIGDYVKTHNVGYLDIETSLEQLEKNDYLMVERKSEPVYHLTSKFMQSLEFISKLEEETVKIIVNDLKEDKQFSKFQNLDKIVESKVYSALVESINA